MPHNNETFSPDCRDCEYCACDTDGLYCSEDHSLKNSSDVGFSIHIARERDCGPEAKFFITASLATLQARGRA